MLPVKLLSVSERILRVEVSLPIDEGIGPVMFEASMTILPELCDKGRTNMMRLNYHRHT